MKESLKRINHKLDNLKNKSYELSILIINERVKSSHDIKVSNKLIELLKKENKVCNQILELEELIKIIKKGYFTNNK